MAKLPKTLKRTGSKAKTYVYTSDLQDYLAFNYEFTALVEGRNMIGTVGDVQFTDEDSSIWTKNNMKNFSCAEGVLKKAK